MKKPIFGDIFELKTNKGFAYIQYVNKYNDPPNYGDLVRLLDGTFSERPTEFKTLAEKREAYYLFIFSVRTSIKWGDIELVGHEEVPKKFKTIPEFRITGVPDPITRKVDFWRLWKNGKEYPIGKMKRKYLDTPTLGVSNIKGLIEEIEDDYTPRNDISVTGVDNPDGTPIKLLNKRNVIDPKSPNYKRLVGIGEKLLDKISGK